MADMPKSRTPSALWRRASIPERFGLCLVACVMLVGTAFVSHGLYMKGKAELSQFLLKRSFAALVEDGSPARPWPWADFTAEAKIELKRLGQLDIVLAGATGEALAFGPARLLQTPEPGASGTSVIAAHRDTHFDWLEHVVHGDVIEITLADGTLRQFEVKGTRIVHWQNSGIDPHAPGQWLALSTCWPFDAREQGDLRFIVDAKLIGA